MKESITDKALTEHRTNEPSIASREAKSARKPFVAPKLTAQGTLSIHAGSMNFWQAGP